MSPTRPRTIICSDFIMRVRFLRENTTYVKVIMNNNLMYAINYIIIDQMSILQVGYSLLSDGVISSKEEDCLLGFESEENNFNAEEEDPDLNDISEFVDTLQPYISLAVPAVSSADTLPSRSRHSPKYTDKSRNSISEEKLAVKDFEEVESDEAYTSSDEETLLTKNVYRNEPEIVLSVEESIWLQKLVETHNERYRSVNFGEELIKVSIISFQVQTKKYYASCHHKNCYV